MKAPPFRYHRPRSLAEALNLMARLDNARVLAGGQSLMPMMNFRLASPDDLVDLGGIADLVGIVETDTTLEIGTMTTQRALERSALVARACPLLAETIRLVGHQQTRNRGTIGGSLCHLDPGAELPVAAAALDVTLVAQGSAGERRIAFADFPAGYLSSCLAPDEILTRVVVPKAPPRTVSAFLEFNRRQADFAIVSSAVTLSLADDDRIAQVALALGGSYEAPVRLRAAERAMKGEMLTPALIESAVHEAQSIPCDGDGVYPEAYRRDLAGVMMKRALVAASAKVGSKIGV